MIYRYFRIINISISFNNLKFIIKIKLFSYTITLNCKWIQILKKFILKFWPNTNSYSQSYNQQDTEDSWINNFSKRNKICLVNCIQTSITNNTLDVCKINWYNTLEILITSVHNNKCQCNLIKYLVKSSDVDFLSYLWKLVKILKYSNNLNILSNNQQLLNDHQCINSNLTTILIQRACKNVTIASNFYWYLHVEIENHKYKNHRYYLFYENILNHFINNLRKTEIIDNLDKQKKFINNLQKILSIVDNVPGRRRKKLEKLKILLQYCESFEICLTNFEPFAFILAPNIYVQGIVHEKTYLFNSSLMPIKITFFTTEKNIHYVAIFKRGNDLRQDQMILEMIKLIDQLLKSENINLQFTTYKIVPTNIENGFIEYVESSTITDIINNYGNIQNFFRIHRPNVDAPYGIQSNTMNTFVQSCAGYSIITYLLGIGDRHMDNILITENGKLFHIDFSYICGKDPKPMQPLINLCNPIIEAMGGIRSENYYYYRKYCYLAFLCLRRYSHIILSSFLLMMDEITDREIRKIEKNFRLDLNDSEALIYIRKILDKSIDATIPVLVNKVHKIVQYLKE